MAERAECDAHPDGRGEEPEPLIDAQRQCCQGTGERHMAQRVAGEDLGPQHDEVADQSYGCGDRGAGEQCMQQEWWPRHGTISGTLESAVTLPCRMWRIS